MVQRSLKSSFALAIPVMAASWVAGGSAASAAVPPSGPEYSWSQGQTAVPMGSANGRVCFLTRVTGRFEGGGEVARTFISGGSWYLGGNSLQSGVGASARCVSVSSYSGEYHWSQGALPTAMGSANNRACFLTRVTGKFEGGGEVVQTFTSWDTWYLGGNSLQAGVGASARCVNLAAGGEAHWTQGETPAYLGPSGDRTCFLTRMTGRFKGGGEVVRTYESGGAWFLGGSSLQAGVAASARCL